MGCRRECQEGMAVTKMARPLARRQAILPDLLTGRPGKLFVALYPGRIAVH